MDSTITQQQRGKIQHQALHRGPHGLGTGLNPKPDVSRGRAQLRRQWTTCKNRPPGTVMTAALPLPFMELSVSVVDTLDLLRSSVEEEIVFQATLQVPAHHAIACRIDAYDTPFANAPALKAEPHQLTENDKKFAACLASPPDLEEAQHSFVFSRPANVIAQRQAPELRAGSGLLTVTLSMRQRQSSQKQQDDDPADDDTALPPDAGQTLDSSHEALQRQGSLLVLQRTGSLSGRSSSFTQQLRPSPIAAAGRAHSRAFAEAIPEEPAAAAEQDNIQSSSSGGFSRVQHSTAADDWAAEDYDAFEDDIDDVHFEKAPSQLQSRSILRLESFSPAGRRQYQEVPLATRSGNALASLLGFGYMVLYTWQARSEPASGLIKRHVDAFAGTGHARNRLSV